MERSCTAHSKRTGQPCGRAPIKGGVVCAMHGGAAPQVKRAAEERIAAMVEPALTQLARLIEHADSDSVKLSAIKDVLDRAGYKPKDKLDVTSGGKTMAFTLNIGAKHPDGRRDD